MLSTVWWLLDGWELFGRVWNYLDVCQLSGLTDLSVWWLLDGWEGKIISSLIPFPQGSAASTEYLNFYDILNFFKIKHNSIFLIFNLILDWMASLMTMMVINILVFLSVQLRGRKTSGAWAYNTSAYCCNTLQLQLLHSPYLIIFSTTTFKMVLCGRGIVLRIEVENVDLCGKFAFPKEFCRSIGKHYFRQKPWRPNFVSNGWGQ